MCVGDAEEALLLPWVVGSWGHEEGGQVGLGQVHRISEGGLALGEEAGAPEVVGAKEGHELTCVL